MATVIDRLDLRAAGVTSASCVVVATQGHYDEAALEAALESGAAYVGLVASATSGGDRPRISAGSRRRRRGARAACTRPPDSTSATCRPRTSPSPSWPSWCSCAPPARYRSRRSQSPSSHEEIDPVCHMTVTVADARFQTIHEGRTYYFCSAAMSGVVPGRPPALPRAGELSARSRARGTRASRRSGRRGRRRRARARCDPAPWRRAARGRSRRRSRSSRRRPRSRRRRSRGRRRRGRAAPRRGSAHRVGPMRVARLARVGQHRDAVPVGERPVVVEAGLAPASPAGGGDASARRAPRGARRARGTGTRARRDARWRGRPAPLDRTRAAAARPAGPQASRIGSGRISTGPRPRLAVDRRAGGGLDQIEHAVEREPSCSPVEPELLVRDRGRAAAARSRGRCPAGGWPSRPRARSSSARSSSRPRHGARRPRRPIQRRKSADVGFDNVGWASVSQLRRGDPMELRDARGRDHRRVVGDRRGHRGRVRPAWRPRRARRAAHRPARVARRPDRTRRRPGARLEGRRDRHRAAGEAPRSRSRSSPAARWTC